MIKIDPSSLPSTTPLSQVDGGIRFDDGRSSPAAGVDFARMLEKSVNDVNELGRQAVQASHDLAAGKTDDLHGTMITVKEAEISIKLAGTVRNRILDAFNELWRINV